MITIHSYSLLHALPLQSLLCLLAKCGVVSEEPFYCTLCHSIKCLLLLLHRRVRFFEPLYHCMLCQYDPRLIAFTASPCWLLRIIQSLHSLPLMPIRLKRHNTLQNRLSSMNQTHACSGHRDAVAKFLGEPKDESMCAPSLEEIANVWDDVRDGSAAPPKHRDKFNKITFCLAEAIRGMTWPFWCRPSRCALLLASSGF